MHRTHVRRPLRIDVVGHHLGDEARTAGTGEDHPARWIAQPIAEEAVERGSRLFELVRKLGPQRRLLGDFFGRELAACGLPVRGLREWMRVHATFLLDAVTIRSFFRKVKYRKLKERYWMRRFRRPA